MSVDERSRHQLFQRLDDVLGAEAASTMMALVPPVGWADVATKHDVLLLKDDLAQLEGRMGLRFEAMESRFEARFEIMDSRFEAMDSPFEARFESIESRFEALDSRFETLDSRFEALEHKVIGTFRAELNNAIQSQTRSLAITLAGTLVSLGGLGIGMLLLR